MIDPEELEALARQLEEEMAVAVDRSLDGLTERTPPEVAVVHQDRHEAHSRMLTKLVDAVDALRDAAAEARKSYGL